MSMRCGACGQINRPDLKFCTSCGGNLVPAGKPEVVLRLGPGSGRDGTDIELRGSRFSIGRGSACDLSIEGPVVSRVHCHLARENKGWAIEDAGSSNGLFVNGSRIERARLRSDDDVVLGIGGPHLRVVSLVGAEATRPEGEDRTAKKDRRQEKAKPLPAPPVSGAGRPHNPLLAVLAAVLIPGAGQSYNGRPIRGVVILFLSVLILPWLLSIWAAYARANRMCREGGRFGKGGLIWVGLQGWLAFDVALLALICLSVAGVLR